MTEEDVTEEDVIIKWEEYYKMTPLEWDRYLTELDRLDKELKLKEAKFRFYEWYFETMNSARRETLEKMYGQELPEGVNV